MVNKKSKTNQIEELILETINTDKPDTTDQLIKLIHTKTASHSRQITKALIKLERQDKIHFTKKTYSPTLTLKAYIFSSNLIWYWLTIVIAIVTVTAVFTIIEDTYPLVYLRQILGAVFVLFLPGFAFIKSLYPSKDPITTSSENFDTIERLTLSLGLSIVLTAVTGLVLNYTPWGIRLTPITLILLALTIVFATAAVLREYRAKAQVVKSVLVS